MNLKLLTYSLVLLTSLFLGACSITPSVANEYKLSSFSSQQLDKHPARVSILVNKPEAVAGYQTEEMLYIIKPYELTPFAKNAWIDPPADMLLPLLVQSMETSGYFKAVASSPTAESTDYRLDTQLIQLHQNFLCKPSTIDFAAKIVLANVPTNRIIASKLIRIRIPTPMDNPYGGVIAANQATLQFTKETTQFVIKHL